MYRLNLLVVLAAACGSSSPKATPPSVTSNTAQPHAVDENCVDIASDFAKRTGGTGDPVPQGHIPDLDGDGVLDMGMYGGCLAMAANCNYHLYGTNNGCSRYLGQVEVSEVSAGISCVEPPADLVPCKLSASRMMIHGELYEYFYTFSSGAYVEAGVGHKGDPEPHL